MDAVVIYEILRDSSIERRGKNKLGALPENFTERDVLKAIDDYFQELVREHRENKGKKRDRRVERLTTKILVSLMGYESEGEEKIKDVFHEVDASLRFLIRLDGIRGILAERNNGILEDMYRKNKKLESERIRMGE